MKFLGIEPVATVFVCFVFLLAFYLSIHLSICINRLNKVLFEQNIGNGLDSNHGFDRSATSTLIVRLSQCL